MRLIIPLLLLAACQSGGLTCSDIHVRDADTIVLDGRNGTPVRFEGVDAPETDTPEGLNAKQWMIGFVTGKTVRCELTGEMHRDHHIGTCDVDGGDLSATVIAAGHALGFTNYSGGRYARFEKPAAKSRLKRARYC
ncbi:thermonuclease family protein [Ruegeria sp. 2205SS24-7]|uniref:thermonuclease family protein n=1 Tax=Ruegeria discodermiae TaxID=3064389 RepID=UPI00274140DD|nr:thermonuclease family protein [Ruegeria sp. 2205SS24-7]MDP5219927.1 thermonuclease family protein [Ruegeria sp. 2205SS24-7]